MLNYSRLLMSSCPHNVFEEIRPTQHNTATNRSVIIDEKVFCASVFYLFEPVEACSIAGQRLINSAVHSTLHMQIRYRCKHQLLCDATQRQLYRAALRTRSTLANINCIQELLHSKHRKHVLKVVNIKLTFVAALLYSFLPSSDLASVERTTRSHITVSQYVLERQRNAHLKMRRPTGTSRAKHSISIAQVLQYCAAQPHTATAPIDSICYDKSCLLFRVTTTQECNKTQHESDIYICISAPARTALMAP